MIVLKALDRILFQTVDNDHEVIIHFFSSYRLPPLLAVLLIFFLLLHEDGADARLLHLWQAIVFRVQGWWTAAYGFVQHIFSWFLILTGWDLLGLAVLRIVQMQALRIKLRFEWFLVLRGYILNEYWFQINLLLWLRILIHCFFQFLFLFNSVYRWILPELAATILDLPH